jgi:hypothetical protein
LGYGVESVRSWVRQAEIDDGVRPGMSSSEAERAKDLGRRSASCGGPTRFCGDGWLAWSATVQRRSILAGGAQLSHWR